MTLECHVLFVCLPSILTEQNVIFERVKLIAYFLAVLMVFAYSLLIGGRLFLVRVLDDTIGQVLRLQSLTSPNTGKVLFEGVRLNIISSDMLNTGGSVRILGRQTNPFRSWRIVYLAGKLDSSAFRTLWRLSDLSHSYRNLLPNVSLLSIPFRPGFICGPVKVVQRVKYFTTVLKRGIGKN